MRRAPKLPALALIGALAIFSIYSAGRYVRGVIYGFPDPYGLRGGPLPSPSPSALPSAGPR